MTALFAAPMTLCNRVAQNRRKAALLAIAGVLLTAPFILGISYGLAEGVTWQLSRQARLNRFHELRMQHRMARRGANDVQADLKAANTFDAGEKRMRQEILLLSCAGLAAALGIFVFGFVPSSTNLLLALSSARPAGEAEEKPRRNLEILAKAAGLPVPKLYIVHSHAANAFSAGLNPETSAVAVTTGLLELLDDAEMEAVLAHQVSIIGNLDSRVNVMSAAFGAALFVPELFHRHLSKFKMGRTLALLPLFAYVFLLAPLLSAILRWSASRSQDLQADTDAVRITGKMEALKSALAKIGAAGSWMRGCNAAFWHLYFADPAPAGVPNSMLGRNAIASHAPLQQRISRLNNPTGERTGSTEHTILPEIKPPVDLHPATPVIVSRIGLTPQQLAFSAGFAVMVFAGMLILLITLGGK